MGWVAGATAPWVCNAAPVGLDGEADMCFSLVSQSINQSIKCYFYSPYSEITIWTLTHFNKSEEKLHNNILTATKMWKPAQTIEC